MLLPAEIVCQVSVYPEMGAAILKQLATCDQIVICYDSLCDLTKQLRHFTDPKRIASIRSSAPHAKILRQVEIRYDDNFEPNHEAKIVEASLAGGLFDGVELVFDSTQLDKLGQVC